MEEKQTTRTPMCRHDDDGRGCTRAPHPPCTQWDGAFPKTKGVGLCEEKRVGPQRARGVQGAGVGRVLCRPGLTACWLSRVRMWERKPAHPRPNTHTGGSPRPPHQPTSPFTPHTPRTWWSTGRWPWGPSHKARRLFGTSPNCRFFFGGWGGKAGKPHAPRRARTVVQAAHSHNT